MAQYDLGFYKDSKWYDCAVITSEPIELDDTVQSETLPDYEELYLSFATANSGEGLSDAYSVAVYIDGDFCRTITLDPLQADVSRKFANMKIGTFSAGAHTLEMKLLSDAEDASPSDNYYQNTFNVKTTGRESYFQAFYGGDTYSLDFTKSFQVDYGKYSLSGNFIGTEAGRRVNAQVVICDSHNKVICSVAVKNGKLNYKEFILTKGTYKVYVMSTDGQNTADTITFSIAGDVFYKSDYEDNSIAHVSKPDSERYTVTVQESPRTIISNGWVGLGDTLSLRRIEFDCSGKYTFTVNTTDKIKISVIQVITSASGRKTEKKVASKSVSGKTKYGKDIDLSGVLLEKGTYYLQAEALSADKGTNADFSVKVSSASVFYTDCDNGANNYLYDKKQDAVWNSDVLDAAALVIDGSFLEDGKSAIRIDTDPENVIEHKDDEGTTFTNFIGFGDATDFRKIELKSAAKLSFDLAKTTGGAAKLVVYTVNKSGKMAVASSKLTLSVKAAATDGALKKQVVLDKGVYYIAVQSTDAKKGKNAYYNVSLNADSFFYTDGDFGTNNYNSKTKKVDADVMKDENAAALHAGDPLRLDGVLAGEDEINHDGYINFVGSGDESDVVRIQANAGMKLSLTVTATDAVSLVIYGLQKNGTLKTLKTVKSKDNVAELVDFELKAKSAPGGQFYVGVTSTNAKKGSSAYYKVDVVGVSGLDSAPLAASNASSLAMPETSDSLAMTDSPSLGNYGADALADASASSLADLDGKTAGLSLGMLA